MHDPWLNPGSIFIKSIKNIIGMIKKLWLWAHNIVSMWYFTTSLCDIWACGHVINGVLIGDVSWCLQETQMASKKYISHTHVHIHQVIVCISE